MKNSFLFTSLNTDNTFTACASSVHSDSSNWSLYANNAKAETSGSLFFRNLSSMSKVEFHGTSCFSLRWSLLSDVGISQSFERAELLFLKNHTMGVTLSSFAPMDAEMASVTTKFKDCSRQPKCRRFSSVAAAFMLAALSVTTAQTLFWIANLSKTLTYPSSYIVACVSVGKFRTISQTRSQASRLVNIMSSHSIKANIINVSPTVTRQANCRSI